ncbi:nuclear pore complex protein Nup93 [Lepeophtheirus salmonis]|uniref:nuclear pore complex protein Nup93 n=1 Tax=Lepeophtheirus salmonis TaxID=72036 RepID=UPI001AE302F7|nr:nuclear pore complex protein Nup93-like [Lepeophtheirus salmonis]
MAGNLNDLLQAAEQLTTEIEDSSELPRVKRNLKQLVEAGQQLYSKTNRETSQQEHLKASILLGSKGIDLPSISNKLEALSNIGSSGFESIEPLRVTDIAGFLRNERENAILSLIEETRQETLNNGDRLHWESLASEWESDKQRILNALLVGGSDLADITSGMKPEIQTRVHDPVSPTSLDATEMKYAKKIEEYNVLVSSGSVKPSLVHKFLSIYPEEEDQEICVLWSMVSAMMFPSTKLVPRAEMSKAIVSKAKRYLESAFKKFMTITVFSNLRKAELGGTPSTLNTVRSYLNVRLPDSPGLEDGLVDGVPIWPLIYFCLRCGDLEAAIKAATSAGHGLGEMTKLLSEASNSSDRRLSPQSENIVRLSYRRSLRQSTDPYKRAVYCMLGACDHSDEHAEIATSLDDYLWIKLSMIREDEADSGLTLSQFQILMVEEYGESHFSAFDQPLLYFQVLFLTGQFESAIEFLFRVDRLRAHSVHIALSMFENNQLLLPSNIQAPLLSRESSDKKPIKRLNLARCIILFVRKFEFSDPKEALHYFYFLRSMKGAKGDNLFTSCVSELVLKSLEFDRLLGVINSDGSRSTGLIDKFSQHIDTQKIIENVASDSEHKGMFEDSVKLYDLAKKHEKVIELLNKLLSQVVSQSPVAESRRDRLQRKAVDIAKRYRANGHTASRETIATFFLLLDLMTFFDLYHMKKYDDAIDAVLNIKVVPLNQSDIDFMVSNFRLTSDEVRRNLPDLLLAVMNILFSQYKQTKSKGRGNEGGRERNLETLRNRAKSLITFAGIIPYRMPGDTNARLVQMEVLMN